MFLETVSGKQVNVLDPQADQIDIEDIAWALSRTPRFAGHTIPYIPYSVAQHSIQVMKELNESSILMMHGLLHDAAEAYLGDIPSPVKHIPGFKEEIKLIENKLLTCIYKSFDISFPNEVEEEKVHHADMIQRAVEAHNFMYSRGKEWNLPRVSFKKLQEFEDPLTSVAAYEMFLYYYNELRGKI